MQDLRCDSRLDISTEIQWIVRAALILSQETINVDCYFVNSLRADRGKRVKSIQLLTSRHLQLAFTLDCSSRGPFGRFAFSRLWYTRGSASKCHLHRCLNDTLLNLVCINGVTKAASSDCPISVVIKIDARFAFRKHDYIVGFGIPWSKRASCGGSWDCSCCPFPAGGPLNGCGGFGWTFFSCHAFIRCCDGILDSARLWSGGCFGLG
jgi:hypothetical protein